MIEVTKQQYSNFLSDGYIDFPFATEVDHAQLVLETTKRYIDWCIDNKVEPNGSGVLVRFEKKLNGGYRMYKMPELTEIQ